MMGTVSQNDRRILRTLAQRQAEIAHSPDMELLTKEWYRHNALQGGRPLFTIESWTFQQDIPLEAQQCESEFAQELERTLLTTLANHAFIPDDTVVAPVFKMGVPAWFKPFGLDVKRQELQNSVGHQFIHQLEDLESDYGTLGKSTWGSTGMEEVLKRQETINELFGDILPAEIIGGSIGACPTQDIVHLMGLQNMFYAMNDYPELFRETMDRLCGDYAEFHQWLADQKLLQPTVSYGGVGNGSYAFNTELPSVPPVGVHQVWGYMDSQETVGVDPHMFEELIFPAYRKVADRYGMLSYGCCEPVDGIWDNCLSHLPNLRKVSISAWCNEEAIGEKLRGTKTIYFRKPSPNYLGVGAELDEDGWRAHMRHTMKAARGCQLEIAQRDVYTVTGNLPKIKRFIEIAREAIAQDWA